MCAVPPTKPENYDPYLHVYLCSEHQKLSPIELALCINIELMEKEESGDEESGDADIQTICK